jgi:glucokinase
VILAGDVGGTKIHLGLYRTEGSRLYSVCDHKYKAHEFGSLVEVISHFIETYRIERTAINTACVGCPGPAQGGRALLTNLPWTVDVNEVAQTFEIGNAYLLNDLEANAYGIKELTADCIHQLSPGNESAIGNRALIAAGTGLGEALLVHQGSGGYLPVPSEGGHSDFAPNNDREIALLVHLRQTFKEHVSVERVVSGMGIRNIYGYLRDVEEMDEPAWLRERMQLEDPNAVISSCAENGTSVLCIETMEMFSAAYGAEAGNLALKALALGGVYLGGGIAPKILGTLSKGSFMRAFRSKGRLSKLIERIPVQVVMNEQCALIGAAAFAHSQIPS